MGDEEMFRRVDAGRLERLVAGIFAAAGLRPADAELMGRVLTDADLRGIHSHGTRYVATYVRALRAGQLNPTPEARLVHSRGAIAVLDADRGVGHIAAVRAMELAIERARAFGVGTVSIRNNGHCGALAYYTLQAAEAGCIGFAATTGGIAMAPWGGRERRIGLNPIAWSAPTRRGWAFNLDMAPSVVAGSKLLMAMERGEKIPLGWALDAEGKPTDDPEEGLRRGTLVPIGGPKGIGIAMAADILCGVLSGGKYHTAGPGGGGQIMQAIDISFFQPLEEFLDRMERMIEFVKSSALAPGSEGIFFPGEIEYNRRQERLQHGIPLDRPTRQALREEAERAGIAYDIEL